MTEIPAHALPVEEVLARLAAADTGLTATEAARRLAEHGANALPAAKPRPGWLRFLGQFRNVLIYVLIGAAAVTAALGHWVDAGVILAVVVANAVIGHLQEGRAEQAMAAIRGLLALRAAVVRDGARHSIPADALVPGDIVLVEPGDRVPADLRILACHGLTAEEAVLTGESVPVTKDPAPVAPDAALGDRRGMLFAGSTIAAGTARGVVTATGQGTEMGRIGGLLSSVEVLTTPLVRQMDEFARWLSVLILLLAGLLLVWATVIGHHDFAEMFMAVVSLSVAAIPEGLPAVMTITLAIGVQAMARRHAIVRRLPAIEAIGSVAVICTDKTGTLTRNEMVVTAAETDAGGFAVGGDGYAPRGTVTPDPAPLADLARAALVCNDAALREKGGTWHVEGDPMEGALLAFAAKVDPALTGPLPRLDAIPFDARHRFMAVLEDGPQGRRLWVKGAPERVMAMCDGLDPDHWHARAEALAALGLRVLAFATATHPGDRIGSGAPHGLRFLGLVGLMDPPRPEAVAAVAEVRRAGIRVKMITGDHAGTAGAIAAAIGLGQGGGGPEDGSPGHGAPGQGGSARGLHVLTGAQIDRMDDARLAAEVLACDVFARTSPEHKLRLVSALQSHGLSVAMTGDGVNDAPALKRADVGIAMGLKGSETAKEAADLVLSDDNFASIAAAVREGRTVFDNLRKVISFELPTSAGEALVMVVVLLFALALPVTPVQILWINLVTGVTLGLALAFEPTEAGTMLRPPRPPGAGLLSPALIWHVILVSLLFMAAIFGVFRWALDRGLPVEVGQTMAMNVAVVLEIFHLFFIRNIHGASLTWAAVRGTRVVWATVIAITAAQVAVTYLPLFHSLLGTAPVPLFEGVVVVATGVVFLVILETEKQMRLAFRRESAA